MIRGVHTMFYSSEPEALRAFLRDKLGFPYSDVGEGWLIFDLPEADMGCHPADPDAGPLRDCTTSRSIATTSRRRSRSCDRAGSSSPTRSPTRGYGLVTHFKMPGDVEVQLYQPRYEKRPVTT